MSDSTTGAFRFACPKCGNRLRAEASQAGTRCDCPKCGAAMRVPSPGKSEKKKTEKAPTPAVVSKSAPAESNSPSEPEEFGFSCAHCDTRLHALVSHVGGKLECPDCGVIATIPPPAPEKPASQYATPFEDIEAYEVEDPHAPVTPESETTFSYQCFICDSVLPATMGQVGEIAPCPDCGHRQKIAAPRKPSKPSRPSAMDLDEIESYSLHAPIDTPAPELFVDAADTEEYVRRARERGILRGDYERPPLPSRPFGASVCSFPFTKGVWPRTLVISLIALAGMAPLHFVVQNADKMTGFSLIILVVCLLFGGIVTGLGMIVASGQFLNIYSSTAGGNEEIDWPDAVFVDWMFDFAYLVYSFSVSAAPAWIGVWSLARLGIEIPLAGLLVFSSGFLLHPLMFLTITGAESALIPFAPDVWKGFVLAKKYIVAFYVRLFLLDLAVVLFVVFVTVLTPSLFPFVVPIMGVAVAMIYFRLLGRLAWCCSDAVSAAEEAAIEEEEEPEKDAIDRAHEAAL